MPARPPTNCASGLPPLPIPDLCPMPPRLGLAQTPLARATEPSSRNSGTPKDRRTVSRLGAPHQGGDGVSLSPMPTYLPWRMPEYAPRPPLTPPDLNLSRNKNRRRRRTNTAAHRGADGACARMRPTLPRRPDKTKRCLNSRRSERIALVAARTQPRRAQRANTQPFSAAASIRSVGLKRAQILRLPTLAASDKEIERTVGASGSTIYRSKLRSVLSVKERRCRPARACHRQSHRTGAGVREPFRSPPGFGGRRP